MCIFLFNIKFFVRVKKPMAINPAITGHRTHVPKIVINTLILVADPVYKFHPTMAPTMACVVDTGKPAFVIRYTDNPAATHAAKAPGSALMAPSLPNVSVVPAPLIMAPSITKILHIIAAVLKRTIRVPTAVPKTFAASFAPKDQPRNNPPRRKIIIEISINY
jgi:hypothetical protein